MPTSTNSYLPPKLTALAALVVLSAVLLGMVTPNAQSSLRAEFQNCGSIPSLTTWSIKAKRVGCHLARRVVRVYVTTYIENSDDKNQTVLGFSCSSAGYYGDGGLYRCNADRKVVKFARGG